MSWNDHDHRGEYAREDHDHYHDYAGKRHDHYDLERADERAQQAIRELRDELDSAYSAVRELRADLGEALGRIGRLEARHEAKVAAVRELAGSWAQPGAVSILADAGREVLTLIDDDQADEQPEPEEYDPGPECDDEGGMSEYRYTLPEDYQRGQS